MPLFKEKKTPTISPERLYRSIPVINPSIKYEEDPEGIVTIMIPVSAGGSKQAFKNIRLDIVGSKVWKKIDGKTALSEIIQWMKKEFMIVEREADTSLTTFMKNLLEKKLVILILPPPKPRTAEVREEFERIKTEMEELEKNYKKKKVDEKTYMEIKDKYEEAIKEILEKEKLSDKA